MDNVLFLF